MVTRFGDTVGLKLPYLQYRTNKLLYRRKERADFKFRLDKATLNQDDLKRQVRRQMRTAQKSTRSKDTTQSLYTCVFDA